MAVTWILSAQEAAHEAGEAAAHGGGEAGGASFPPFDPSLFASQLVWFALTFGALFFIVSRFVLPKVQSVLDRRAATLRADLDAAARESAAADAARVDAERVSAEARANARKLVEDMRAKASAELAEEQAKAAAAHGADIARAEAGIAKKRAEAMAQIDSIAADLARDIVTQLTGRTGKASAR